MTETDRINEAIRMAREASEANQRRQAEAERKRAETQAKLDEAALRVKEKAARKLEAYKVRQSRRDIPAPKWWDSLRLASTADCRYPAMMLVRNLLVVAVWLIQVVFVVAVCWSCYVLFTSEPSNEVFTAWGSFGLAASLLNVFWSIVFLLSSESIKIFLDIAENTFRMADK